MNHQKDIWVFNEDDGTITHNGKPFLIVDADCEFQTFEEFKKQALIAAAAQELLSALEEDLETFEYNNHKVKCKPTIDKIKAAISKARGE